VRRYFEAPLGADVVEAPTAGVADGEEAAGAVTGVMVTDVTSPLTAAFCFGLVVPRALRVALNFAAAAAFCSTVNGVRGIIPSIHGEPTLTWVARKDAADEHFSVRPARLTPLSR
jgi:hypothetical protein